MTEINHIERKNTAIKCFTEVQRQISIGLKALTEAAPLAPSTQEYKEIEKIRFKFNEIIRGINNWDIR